MSIMVTINGVVTFAPHIGVLVSRDALAVPPQQLHDMVALAFSRMNDRHLRDAAHGGIGPLAGKGEMSMDAYLQAIEQAEADDSTAEAKKAISRKRRNQFAQQRLSLQLEMINAGTRYVCAAPGCKQNTDLTIDHKIPLSRGCTDDITNLQFMCRVHNSQKGDHMETDE